MFTCSDKWKLNTNMRNRPGRIFYMLDYHGLDEKFIREYCDDNLKNKNHINMVCVTSRVFGAFNFDMLKAMVEEMNRYNETPAEALQFLNARADFAGKRDYSAELTMDGKRQDACPLSWNGIPLVGAVSLSFPETAGSWGPYKTVVFTPEHFQRVDSATGGAYMFVNKKKNHRLTLMPKQSAYNVNFEAIQRVPIIRTDDDTMATPTSTTDSEPSESS
jgi:hypothetical protein